MMEDHLAGKREGYFVNEVRLKSIQTPMHSTYTFAPIHDATQLP